MTMIALFGAGGKMGCRLAGNLRQSDCNVRHADQLATAAGLKPGLRIKDALPAIVG